MHVGYDGAADRGMPETGYDGGGRWLHVAPNKLLLFGGADHHAKRFNDVHLLTITKTNPEWSRVDLKRKCGAMPEGKLIYQSLFCKTCCKL